MTRIKSKSSNGNITDDSSDASPLRQLTIELMKQQVEIEQGGGKAGQDRQHKLGRLFVRERLSQLLDHDGYWLEVQLWAAHEMYTDVGGVPAAGVVTGIGLVHNRPVMVVANDATVKAGAFFPATAKKVLRAQKIATRCNLPLIYLVDSAGVFLPMQDEIFPDEDDFGRIFRNNSVISAMGIPQLAAVMGNCVAGGAYLPVLCDKILMTKGSEMYLAGPSLVKAAIGQQVEGEELGGAKMHAQISGTADFFEENDESCLKRLRALIGMLPEVSSGKIESESKLAGNLNHLYEIVSHDGRKEYDAHDLLNCICDAQSIHEYKADYGKSIVCVYATIGGRKVGILANQKVRMKSPRGELQIGGVIYHDSSDKAARFIMDCNQSQLPLIFFQDVTGFMVGRESEQVGIIRSGAKLVNAVSNSTVPKITVVVGGSFGAGNYAMCGKAFDPTFIFAWPNAKYAVMGAGQASSVLLQLQQRQAERGGKKLDQSELDALRQRVETDYNRSTDIRYGAARGWVDAIIQPHKTREVLIQAIDLCNRSAPGGGFRSGVFQV